MAIERLMVVETEPLLGLRGQRRRLTVSSRMGSPRVPRLRVMEAVAIHGDQRHRHTSILHPPVTVGARTNQRLVDGAEIHMMHRLLERICQRPRLRL